MAEQTPGFVAPAILAPLLFAAKVVTQKLGLVSDTCARVLFDQREIFDGPCFKPLLSQALGIGMTTFAAIVKLPQISNMMSAQSAVGLAASSTYLETLMYLCTSMYFIIAGSDFASYGENIMLIGQNVVIIMLMWTFNKSSMVHIGGVIALFAGFAFMAAELPEDCGALEDCFASLLTDPSSIGRCAGVRPCREWLVLVNVPLMLMSRLPQIFQNMRDGHTGILSIATVGANFLGSLARVFTSMEDAKQRGVEGREVGPLAVYGLSALLNLALALQCVVYRENTRRVLSKEGKRD